MSALEASQPCPLCGTETDLWHSCPLWDTVPCRMSGRALNRDGYALIGRNGKSYLEHKYEWELVFGPRPEANEEGERLVLDHLCRNRACIVVPHLRLVTNGDNVRAGLGNGFQHKTECVQGHAYPENLRRNNRGEGYCIVCQRARSRNAARARRNTPKEAWRVHA